MVEDRVLKERLLQVINRPVHGALNPAWRPGKGLLGGTAEGDAVRRQ